MSDNQKQQIHDDDQQNETQQQTAQQNIMKQIQTQHGQQQKHQQHHQEQVQIKVQSNQQKKDVIDHVGISKYVNYTLDVEDDEKNQVYLRIVGVETKGSAFSKYTVYIIKGHDKNGQINLERRYSEFHALRAAMVQRWPGCFIPSIPTKNFMHKNDKDETVKRERYLNDFVIKMTRLPHLYNSQQFQTFLRSKETDTSNIYSSWSAPTYQAIVNKYRDCFRDLEGKQIDSQTNNVISQFYSRVNKNAALLQKYRAFAKATALSYDKFQQNYSPVFSKIIPNYEKTMLLQYTNGKQNQLVYQNSEQAKLNEHAAVIKQATKLNPYWALYDMIKHEQRDGRAFIEALQARQNLESKKNSVEGKIRDNQKAIIQLMEGKSNIKSVTSKGTKQQIKYKLQVENEELKKQKNMLLILSDIISALVVYIQIPAYQFAKINFYHKTLKKIGGFELNAVQIQADVWKDASKSAIKVGKQSQYGL